MKNTMKIALLMFLSIVIFYSCSKKSDIVQPAPHVTTQSTVTKEDVLKFMLSNTATTGKVHKEKPLWWMLLMDGAGAGGGWFVGGPFGAAELGALASAMLEFPCPSCATSNPFKGLKPINNFSSFANSANPYDYVGLAHDQILYNLSTNTLAYCTDGSTDASCTIDQNKFASMEASTYATLTGQNVNTLVSGFPASTLWSDYTKFYNSKEPSGQEQNYFYNSGQMDQFVYDAINNYVTASNSYTNYSDLYKYTVSVESQLAASNATESEKQTLFCYFSVARYSGGFWANLK